MEGRPLSVVVIGNSLTFDQVPPRSAHQEGSYGEVLRDVLTEAGIAVTLHLEGRWFDADFTNEPRRAARWSARKN